MFEGHAGSVPAHIQAFLVCRSFVCDVLRCGFAEGAVSNMCTEAGHTIDITDLQASSPAIRCSNVSARFDLCATLVIPKQKQLLDATTYNKMQPDTTTTDTTKYYNILLDTPKIPQKTVRYNQILC